jgi:hypothetical protein
MRAVRTSVAVAVLVTAAFAGHAMGQEAMYIRGDFNGWGLSHPMTHVSGNHYSLTVNLEPDSRQNLKAANESWSIESPGINRNLRVLVPGSGAVRFHFHLGPNEDGWMPSGHRVGYGDSAHGWDIMGSFNGWADPVVTLTSLGGGVYSGQYIVPVPGTYAFKYRKEGDWDISIGDDFGNNADDVLYTTTTPNELVIFTLDLPGGRHQAIPEPAAVGVLAIAGLMLVRRRR